MRGPQKVLMYSSRYLDPSYEVKRHPTVGDSLSFTLLTLEVLAGQVV